MVHLRKSFTLLAIFGLLFLTSIVYAEVSSTNKKEIQDQIALITNLVNKNDINSIANIVSPNARPDLRNEIESNLAGKMVQFQQSVSSYEDLGNDQVKVKCRYSAAGPGWSINGMPNYYIFEKSGDSWLLVDTDFYQKMGADYVSKFVEKIFLIILPIIIIFSAFWFWMLIDCIKRQFKDKTMWILLIVFFNFIGAILYFFMMRKKLIQQEKMRGGNINAR